MREAAFANVPGSPTAVTLPGPAAGPAAGSAAEIIPNFSSYAQEPPGFFESIKGAFTPGDDGVGFFEGLSDAFFPTAEKKAIRAGLRSNPEFNALDKYQQYEVLTELARDSAPSFMRRWAPVLGLGSAVVAFQPTEEQEQFAAIPGTEYRDLTEVMEADPERYRFRQALPGTTTIRQQAGTGVGPAATIRYSAHGGAIEQDFPPRDGAIAGPGSGVSDDVPAMLSDGEFVFTSKAVRGAGNGSRVQGNQTLYSLMRNFEGRA